ncbi:MAG: hypothetical protein ACRDF9_10235 [Candidatus Limnocylindria bacterium]
MELGLMVFTLVWLAIVAGVYAARLLFHAAETTPSSRKARADES